MNTQAFGINGPRQDRIEDGVLDLLQGEIPDTASPHNIQILAGMSLIAFVTMILIVSMIWSITRLKRYSVLRSTGFPKVWRHIVLPVVLETLWVIMLVGMVQIATGSRSSNPLSFMLENVPDMAWMIVLSAVIAIGWGILRTILTIVVSRKS